MNFSGPHKNAQVIMFRGLTSPWKFPLYIDFDVAVSKDVYFENIYCLEELDVHVLISTCDQGSRNEQLAKELKINPENHWSPNPYDPTRKVFWSYDFVHLFKSFRNNCLDFVVCFDDGTYSSKKDFEELVDFCAQDELSCGFFLKDLHLECQGQDRQDVTLATQLISEKVACLFRRYFGDESKRKAADVCDIMYKGRLDAFQQYPHSIHLLFCIKDSSMNL